MQAPLGKSDHVVVKVDFRFVPEEQPCREINDYKKANWKKMREQLTIDWDNFFQDCNVISIKCGTNLKECIKRLKCHAFLKEEFK